MKGKERKEKETKRKERKGKGKIQCVLTNSVLRLDLFSNGVKILALFGRTVPGCPKYSSINKTKYGFQTGQEN